MENSKGLQNIKKLAQMKNKTILSLSIDLGISKETLSRYITGKLKPNINTIIKMAELLNTSTDYILGLTDNPEITNENITANESYHLLSYRRLNHDDKLKVDAYTDLLNDLRIHNKERKEIIEFNEKK